MVNKGKKFEEIIKRDFSLLSQSKITRLFDPVGGYKKIKNVCDFIGYCYPLSFYFEAKITKENTFNLNKLTQYEELIKYKNTKGLQAGVLIWFYNKNKVVWCSIENIEFMKNSNIKSININHKDTYDFELDIKILKIYPKIDFNSLYSFCMQKL